MSISYKLEQFEGPLDLLLHLIEKNKVSIYDIPIAEITDQYLDYVSHMEKEDLDVVSEFLVMAATLLDIKSRMLLPAQETEEGEEEDPRVELVKRLLEYKMYKYMAFELKDRELDAEKVFYKGPTLPDEVAVLKPFVVPLLEALPQGKYEIADDILRGFERIEIMEESNIAPSSLVREFIGGSSFKY